MKKFSLTASLFVIFLSALFFQVNMAQASDLKQDTEIILDCSGSMAGIISGQSKMDIAKGSLEKAIQEIPEGSYIGFRTYGNQFDESQKNCQDSQLIFPIGPINKSELISKIKSLQPKGWTPIDYSLRQAEDDFPVGDEYKKTIILVSDGEETCGGDPCQAIKELTKNGFNVQVNTIGFGVDSKTETQLKCIAEATGGEYRSVNDANGLTEELKTFSKEPVAFISTAQPLPAGGAAIDNATALSPGKYNGFRLEDEKMHYYKIILKPGQLLSVKANFKQGGINADVGGNADLHLYNSDRERLVDNFKGNAGHNEFQWLTPNTAGFFEYNPIYYLSIVNDDSFFKIISFDLNVLIEDKFDANSQTDAPKGFVENPVISVPGNYEGYFKANDKEGSDGYDTYKINIPSKKVLNVKVTPSSSSNVDIDIFNSNKESVNRESGANQGAIVETSYSGGGGEDAYIQFHCSDCRGYEPNKYSFVLSLSDEVEKKDKKNDVSTVGSVNDMSIDKTIKTGVLTWLGVAFLLPLIGGIIFTIVMIIVIVVIVKKYKNNNSSNSPVLPQSQSQSQPQPQQNYQENGQNNENNQNPPSNINPPLPPAPPPSIPPQV